MLFKKGINYPHGLGKDFFETPKALAVKERIDKLVDYIKMKKPPKTCVIKSEKKILSGNNTVCSATTFVSRMQIGFCVISK